MKGLTQHRYISKNDSGKDYYVGDIHGSWGDMYDLLEDRDFDFEHDRLFATGDLIDQGMDSPGALRLLEESWFFSVLGGRELMLLEGQHDEQVRAHHLGNGGEWSYGLHPNKLAGYIRLIQEHMPLAITIDTGWGLVGVIHAEAPETWSCLTSNELSKEQWQACCSGSKDYRLAKEGRGRLVPGIDMLVSGSVGCDQLMRGPNQCWIDTYERSGFYILTTEELIKGVIKVN
ncbi:metallophosphoesterase [Pontibacterium granulatum]|uniref:metallophosphoesterase n=1 Tax=Pontibacterium granulatum TaxID=2036029 RepID=UPI00249C23D5|nr:metallophosphoesterase [Pontibacterium granulatum]MDI3325835.1 metallophosphoesterase [Pontibacterium granulatum]